MMPVKFHLSCLGRTDDPKSLLIGGGFAMIFKLVIATKDVNLLHLEEGKRNVLWQTFGASREDITRIDPLDKNKAVFLIRSPCGSVQNDANLARRARRRMEKAILSSSMDSGGDIPFQ